MKLIAFGMLALVVGVPVVAAQPASPKGKGPTTQRTVTQPSRSECVVGQVVPWYG